MPTSGDEPASGARPSLGGGARDVEPQGAGLDAGDAVALVDLDAAHRSVLTSTVSSSGPIGAALWPVPCIATRRPRVRAKSTSACTSAALSGSATRAGRWSTARFQAWRAASQPSSPGSTTEPASASRSVGDVEGERGDGEHAGHALGGAPPGHSGHLHVTRGGTTPERVRHPAPTLNPPLPGLAGPAARSGHTPRPQEGPHEALALIAAVTAVALAAPAAASAAEFEGTVVSVNRDNRTFRLHDSERGTVRIKVTRARASSASRASAACARA